MPGVEVHINLEKFLLSKDKVLLLVLMLIMVLLVILDQALNVMMTLR
jgi:hypothetical protein